LTPVFQGKGETLKPATICPTSNANLFLLAGNIELSENETQIAVALSTSSAIPALQNIPGSLCALLRMTAAKNNIDVVIVDMSPSVGAMNQCFLMGSDYFIVPTSPDYYCNQAIASLARVLPRWNDGVAQFRSDKHLYSFSVEPPKFSGIISQRYRPRMGNPALSFQQWIDQIKVTVDTELVPALRRSKMIISKSQFMAAAPGDEPYNLINIADFNSLIAQSQKHSTPVFALSDAQLEQTGYVLRTMKASRDAFAQSFHDLARSIAVIAGIEADA
jgi:chromosome partitioning protein